MRVLRVYGAGGAECGAVRSCVVCSFPRQAAGVSATSAVVPDGLNVKLCIIIVVVCACVRQ